MKPAPEPVIPCSDDELLSAMSNHAEKKAAYDKAYAELMEAREVLVAALRSRGLSGFSL